MTPGGWRKAGFYQLVASDNLPGTTVTVTDTVTGTTFGPWDPGTYVKLTQAVGASASTATGIGHLGSERADRKSVV